MLHEVLKGTENTSFEGLCEARHAVIRVGSGQQPCTLGVHARRVQYISNQEIVREGTTTYVVLLPSGTWNYYKKYVGSYKKK